MLRFLITVLLFSVVARPAPAEEGPTIDPLSVSSLFLNLMYEGQQVATATGFVVQRAAAAYLVTNWHVLSGYDAMDCNLQHPLPDEVCIWHNAVNRLGTWVRRCESLRDALGTSRWVEHPRGGTEIDLAALPLTNLADVQLFPLDLSLADADVLSEVGMEVFIIGFPYGLTGSGKLPIWKTGHIASEPEVDASNFPGFLIDASTRPGMSGSPVVLHLRGPYRTKKGTVLSGSARQTKLMGVFSAQYMAMEIGRVYRPWLVGELLDAAASETKAAP